MGVEIERKFLVASPGWRRGAVGVRYRQGYLCTDPGRVVRVRFEGDRAVLTIKGPRVDAAAPEFNYDLPADEAAELLGLCVRPLIDKTRYRVMHAGHRWEIDQFHGENAGLVVAEIELGRADETFDRPDWLGREVTADHRYANAALTRVPFSAWAPGQP